MDTIFISHATKDTEFAQRLSEDLRRGGYSAVTFADLGSGSGKVSEDVLSDVISSSDYFMPVLTSEIQESQWLKRDIEQALAQETPYGRVTILPVLKESCVLPEPLGVRSPVDFSMSYESGLHGLVDRISAPLESTASRELSQPVDWPGFRDVKRSVLRKLWNRRVYLQELAPSKFENFVARAFEDSGCKVELTQFTQDGGIDLVAIGFVDRSRKQWLMQCKRYAPGSRVGLELVRSLLALDTNPLADETHIVTTSSFLEPASGGSEEQVERLTRSRWVLNTSSWAAIENWLSASALQSKRPLDIEQAHARYATLVDKKFVSSLSSAEQAELLHLEVYLNEVEAEFYEPLKDKLKAALAATSKA